MYSSGTTLTTTATPTLMCANNASDDYSRYSVNVQTLKSGKTTNGDLTYPIALLSADELVMAGAFIYKKNTNFYLQNADTVGSSSWWTMTPYVFSSYVNVFDGSSYFSLSSNNGGVDDPSNAVARPVINLRSDVLVESGDGTKGEGAYKVRLP